MPIFMYRVTKALRSMDLSSCLGTCSSVLQIGNMMFYVQLFNIIGRSESMTCFSTFIRV